MKIEAVAEFKAIRALWVWGFALALISSDGIAGGIVAVGAGPGHPPRVQVFDAASRRLKLDFRAFASRFRGGVNVGVGDVDGDGSPDVIAAAGPGGSPRVRVFDGETGVLKAGPVGSFLAFRSSFRGGLQVASGDVDGDGCADIIVGVATGGPPRVKVFSGRTGAALLDFLAFEASYKGGVRLAAADFRHRKAVDLLVGVGPGGPPRVRIFSGDGGLLLGEFLAFDANFGGGVSLGTGDLDRDGTIDLIAGAGTGGQGSVRAFSGLTKAIIADFRVPVSAYDDAVQVASVDADRDGFDDVVAATGTLHAPSIRAYRGTSAQRIRRYLAFDGSFAGVPAIAGSVQHGRGTNYASTEPVTEEIPVLDRLSQYLPIDLSHPRGQYVPVKAFGIPDNKHVYVISHGWAPGFRAWVDKYLPGHVLKWWETAGFNASAYPPPEPDPGTASPWMFDAYAQDRVPISPTGGLAQQISVADPGSIVLAYSWLDDSATTAAFDNAIPEQAYRSEAMTNINGQRLAAALRQALGTSYNGKVHLLGHSHGSKVATLAAVTLKQWGGPEPQQLTLFDSPESAPTEDLNASNFLWNFLPQLDLTKMPGAGLFVDNYFSVFGIAYAPMRISGQTPLSETVDTQLYAYPYSISYLDHPGDWHDYPPAWYAQANRRICRDGRTNGGLAWSPLFGYDPSGLAAEWEQGWMPFNYGVATQACLVQPFFTITPGVSFGPLIITDADAKPSRTVSTIDLQVGPGARSTFDGTYSKNTGWTGIVFDYAFAGSERGILEIQINDYLAYYVDSEYLPPGVIQHVTLNIGWPSLAQDITITLRPPAGIASQPRVTLSNFQQFDVSLF